MKIIKENRSLVSHYYKEISGGGSKQGNSVVNGVITFHQKSVTGLSYFRYRDYNQ